MTIIENVAYAPVDHEHVYQVVPGENRLFSTGNMYDPVSGEHQSLNASYEEIAEFSPSVSCSDKPPATEVRPEDKP